MKGIGHLGEKQLKDRNKQIQEDNRRELQKVGSAWSSYVDIHMLTVLQMDVSCSKYYLTTEHNASQSNVYFKFTSTNRNPIPVCACVRACMRVCVQWQRQSNGSPFEDILIILFI